MRQRSRTPPSIRIDSYLRRGRRAHARRRRARRADPPVQGAAAQALLRRARLGAVRADLRAARVLPDAHRARDPRSPVPTRSCRPRAPASWSSSAPARRRRRASCSTRWPARARCAATSRSTCPRARSSAAAAELVERVRRALRPRRRSATSSATSSACRRARRRTARIVALLGGTIGNFPPGTRRRLLREIAQAARPGRPPAARHRPRQGPARPRGRLRRRGRASPPSSTATCCT